MKGKFKMKVKELCAAVFALLAAQGAFAVNVVGDAMVERDRIHLAGRDVLTFNQNGTLIVNKATTVEMLLVGGGGGGGVAKTSQLQQGGAGGGGGGVVYKESLLLMPGEYSIVIGEGGAVSENGGNTKISDSSDFVLTAFGGGAGADFGGYAGNDGGSGGGSTFGTVECPAGQAGYGEEGNFGHGGGVASHIYGAGGGGGAGAPGGGTQDPTGKSRSTPGAGGDGVSFAIVGTNVWYAGGGAGFRNGGGNAPGKYIAGGKGGGGACNNTESEPGADGLGGGGCGGSKGGRGVAIFSFVPDVDDVDSDDFRLSGEDELIPLLEESVLIFRGNGTLTVEGSGVVEILAVGGGAGGGAGTVDSKYGSGGGGGGGVVHMTNLFLNAGSYPIVIGEGGEVGVNGGLTEAIGVKAFGGGAGAEVGTTRVGCDGASGGGSANGYNVYTETAGGNSLYAAFANKGNAGGGAVHPYGAGGGGGAGRPGVTSTGDTASSPGSGGDGYCCSIIGKDVWYGGGGAGYRWDGNSRNTSAAGGKGGGGTCVYDPESAKYRPGAGEDGLGGGGSGGAKGGSGIVIIRYRKRSYETIFSGATGGTVNRRGSHFIHTFAENGFFTMPTNGMVEVLIVGGGGGGGANSGDNKLQGGGGGGAGGVVHVTNVVLAAGPYEIVVGAGGAIGQNGEDTTAFDLVAYGGGAGAKYDSRDGSKITDPPYGIVGSNGGSGGGSTHAMRPAETMQEEQVLGGLAIYATKGNLGHDGGISTHVYGASGGGGAGGVGGDTTGASGSTPGNGGIGFVCSITGREVYYAGGGAGFRNKEQINGGLGGGGSCVRADDKQSSTPGKGEDGLGGGGCGGAAGGKGVVIVRYRYREAPGMMLILR